MTPRQFVLDFDVAPEVGVARALVAEQVARGPQATPDGADAPEALVETAPVRQASVVPEVAAVGSTVRISFPFAQETASAVWRRGRSVWMLFDTDAAISVPPLDGPLGAIAGAFEVSAAGEAVVVRLDLSAERFATLGSEGKAWVLSLGDVLLSPTQPLVLQRKRDDSGNFEMQADLPGAFRHHRFNDPVVGDVLEIVTAPPPARGVVRSLEHVDFTALSSTHGLVVRPKVADLRVTLAGDTAVIGRPLGLRLSDLDTLHARDGAKAPELRRAYIELNAERQNDPAVLVRRRESLLAEAAGADGEHRHAALLALTQFLLANRLAEDALGVLAVAAEVSQTEEERTQVRLLTAAANVMSDRPREALAALDVPALADQADALIWRGLARAEAGEATLARSDMLAAEGVVENYPPWLRTRFLLAGARVALDTGDQPMAARYLARLERGGLDGEQVSALQLLSGRRADAQGRTDEALDIFGRVIAADFAPTRVEAIYRTLLALDGAGRIDVQRAINTLSAETLMWRGDWLEAGMLGLLADLYFRNGDYRLGFETVRQAARYAPEGVSVAHLIDRAGAEFAGLYLDGGADRLGDVEALAVFYDFRELTPPGVAGDEMIRKLAERLVRVDLLPQAGDLLDYQVEHRLRGAARSQVAADLALIRIAGRNPEAALRALNTTRLAELPPALERARRVLEARALIDAGREELALDLLTRIEGRDADLLRVDGNWRAGNFGRAAELIELAYSGEAGHAPLAQPARMNLVKAAVGFVLAGDAIGLSRLRLRFSERLSKTPEWPLFDFVSGELSTTSTAFREAAREVAGLDSLNAFLTAYRERYPGHGDLAPTSGPS